MSGFQFALPPMFEREGLPRQERHSVLRPRTKRILPTWDKSAQLPETAGVAKGFGRPYFQLTHSIAAHSHQDGDLFIYQRPASKRGGHRLLRSVRQDSQYALGQIAFIDRIGFDLSSEKSFKEWAWALQV
jgi:hypothetical protein